MRAWVYCMVREERSCKELGKLRQKCIEFAADRRLPLLGITSVNLANGRCHMTDLLHDIVTNDIDYLIVANIELLTPYKHRWLCDTCFKQNIAIVKFRDGSEVN